MIFKLKFIVSALALTNNHPFMDDRASNPLIDKILDFGM